MENGKQPAYPIIGEQGFVELNVFICLTAQARIF